MFVALFLVGTTSFAKTNSCGCDNSSDDLLSGLVNIDADLDLDLGGIYVGQLVNFGDITLQDLVNVHDIDVHDVVMVEDVLNDNDIDILNLELKNIMIDDVLTNVLRDANIISDNFKVVGLMDKKFVVQKMKKRRFFSLW